MKVAFLDRDGVINTFPGLGNYVTKVKDFSFLPGALESIKQLHELGYTIFVVSNQAGVGRGVYSKNKLERINKKMINGVRRSGGRIKKVFYCIHRPDAGCSCRKPETGSIKNALRLIKKTPKQLTAAYFVGDAQGDIKAGKRSGFTTVCVLSGRSNRRDISTWNVRPDYITKNLLEAVKVIEHEDSRHSRLRRSRPHQGC